jgi:hypothetical protein
MDTTSSPTPAVDTISADALPTSFGVLKPVGQVMVGLPTQAQADAAVAALMAEGWPAGAVSRITPSETVADLEEMVDGAGAAAGFGYEITLLRRYLALARQGYRWLLVEVDGVVHAAAAAEIVRTCGATLAIHYRTLTVEELIVDNPLPAAG